MDGLQSDSVLGAQIDALKVRVGQSQIPEGLKEKIHGMVERLVRMAQYGSYSVEYENTSRYIEIVLTVPWNTYSEDALDIKTAEEILNRHQYGLEPVKNRVLEYLAILQLRKNNPELRAREPVLMLVGLAGTGKTAFAYAVADAMGRQLARIPFGGMGDPLTLRGQSRAFPDAEPGAVIKALATAGTRNPVFLLDEIDRVADSARASVMGVLLGLLDPSQNNAFRDHYLDYPFDLSDCLFIATGNNTTNISTAVLDRLEIIQMPSYSDEEKITIASRYVFPRALADAGLKPDAIVIDPQVWPLVVRPLGFDSGIRTLERTILGMCRKVARMIVEGGTQQVHVTPDNVKEFLPTW